MFDWIFLDLIESIFIVYFTVLFWKISVSKKEIINSILVVSFLLYIIDTFIKIPIIPQLLMLFSYPIYYKFNYSINMKYSQYLLSNLISFILMLIINTVICFPLVVLFAIPEGCLENAIWLQFIISIPVRVCEFIILIYMTRRNKINGKENACKQTR